jgi:hypothetical protein
MIIHLFVVVVTTGIEHTRAYFVASGCAGFG